MINNLSYTAKYCFYGALFGCFFPIVATGLDVLVQDLTMNWGNIVKVQQQQPLHWIIDTAPFFLGLFASFAGYRQDKLRNINSNLEDEVVARTKEIKSKNEVLRNEIQEKEIIEGQLKEAIEHAEHAAQAKEEFLINMSHEIRTPMNAVIGMSNYLMEQNPRPDQEESLDLLRYSAKNLLGIINDILDFSKIDAGTIDVNLEPVNLKEIAKHLEHTFSQKISENKITFRTIIKQSIPDTLVTDQSKLVQVLENLISNAIKFSPNGSIDFSMDLTKEDKDYVTVHFSVKDNGIGIAKHSADLIYKAFEQEDSKKISKNRGTGLGLSIVKKLLHVLGSDIHHISAPGQGSEFYFDLTFKKSLSIEGAEARIANGDVDLLENVKVLLVEDNEMNQKVAIRFLQKWNVDYDLAENGLEAIEALENKQYDVILMDLQMPELDGFEATKRIRNSGINTPIIALTAAALVEVKKKTEDCGMNDFITKPFQPNVLREKMINQLGAAQ